MPNLYGIFGETPYRIHSDACAVPKLIDTFKSNTFVQENTVEGSITTCIDLNTMDFYKEEPNEEIYKKFLDYLKTTGITGIDCLYNEFKIGLDYQITDSKGGIVDAGIRYIQTKANEVNVLLQPDETTHALPYRKGTYVNKKFTITRIDRGTYGVMDVGPRGIMFKINAILIYGNLTDAKSSYYIQNLGPSAQDTTFRYGSGTIKSIQDHSVVLFDSRNYGISFPGQRFKRVPNSIQVQVKALLNQFCYVADDTEINSILSANNGALGGIITPPENGNDFGCDCSPFDPIINRPHCPGNYPFPPSQPGGSVTPPPHKPGMGMPIRPGEGWNPDSGFIPGEKPNETPDEKPDEKPDDGNNGGTTTPPEEDSDLKYEWCLAGPTTIGEDLFTVVEDDISDEEFDATSMVKISEVIPYVSDIKAGDVVFKSLVLYQ